LTHGIVFPVRRKKSNLTEIEFYTTLSEPGMPSAFAPKFCGSHMSDGSDWSHYVILEDLTASFSKPAVLDVQIGQQHVGSGAEGSAPSLGLRINGMLQPKDQGPLHHDKSWGGTVTAEDFAPMLEEFLTDSSETLVTQLNLRL